jgi:hypothetical protein
MISLRRPKPPIKRGSAPEEEEEEEEEEEDVSEHSVCSIFIGAYEVGTDRVFRNIGI